MNSGLETSRRVENKESLMRGPLRTIAVLRALNVRNGATVRALAQTTGISRPALYRILETLREAGYVSVDLCGLHYCLTMLIRSLADGFNDEDWVAQKARPVLRALQRKVLWPVDLGTFMNNGMWIRETTRHASPLTIDPGVVGLRFPMLGCAVGRAYLAFCPAADRAQILLNLSRSPERGNELMAKPKEVKALLELTRRQGYGRRYGEPPSSKSGSIAVPILLANSVLGCINLSFTASAFTPAEIADKHVGAMNEAGRKIAASVQRLEDDVAAPELLTRAQKPAASSPALGSIDKKIEATNRRFTEEQIIGFLREADEGRAIKELRKKHGFSEASYYAWKAKFGGMTVSDARRLIALERENGRLKRLLAKSMHEVNGRRKGPSQK